MEPDEEMKEEEEEDWEDDDGEEMEEDGDEDQAAPSSGGKKKKQEVYIPGKSKLGKADGEELEFDPTAYRFLHSFTTENPCLSVDSLRLAAEPSESYPLSLTFVAGTQAEKVRSNAICVLRLSNVHGRSKHSGSDSEDSEDSESEEEDAAEGGTKEGGSGKKPHLQVASMVHHGGINRIRATQLGGGSARVAAVWNEAGKVQLWNLASALAALDKGERRKLIKGEKPLHTFAGHGVEGWGLDWSRCKEGRLASGDNRGRIHLWEMGEGGSWTVDALPLTGHKAAVEDLQWSPNEEALLASASSDHSLALWDTRAKPAEARVVHLPSAHASDVNVLSWSAAREPLLLSGADDGTLKVWSLKTLQYKEPAATLAYHEAPISSVGWCPGAEGEGTVFAAASEDDQVSLWDIAVEPDEAVSNDATEDEQLPPQLLFMHCGQKEVKELVWAPDATGTILTTALDGFNLFRTISI